MPSKPSLVPVEYGREVGYRNYGGKRKHPPTPDERKIAKHKDRNAECQSQKEMSSRPQATASRLCEFMQSLCAGSTTVM